MRPKKQHIKRQNTLFNTENITMKSKKKCIFVNTISFLQILILNVYQKTKNLTDLVEPKYIFFP